MKHIPARQQSSRGQHRQCAVREARPHRPKEPRRPCQEPWATLQGWSELGDGGVRRAASIHVAAISALDDELLEPGIARHFAHCRIDAGRHALQTTADVDAGAASNPFAEQCRTLEDPLLHVAALGLVAREHQIQFRQCAAAPPLLEFVAIERIVCSVAFAEDQPVPVSAECDAFFQQAA